MEERTPRHSQARDLTLHHLTPSDASYLINWIYLYSRSRWRSSRMCKGGRRTSVSHGERGGKKHRYAPRGKGGRKGEESNNRTGTPSLPRQVFAISPGLHGSWATPSDRLRNWRYLCGKRADGAVQITSGAVYDPMFIYLWQTEKNRWSRKIYNLGLIDTFGFLIFFIIYIIIHIILYYGMLQVAKILLTI